MLAPIAALLLASALPFWEATPPEQWTDEELGQLLRQSPWARVQQVAIPGVKSHTSLPLAPVHFFLASARPMELAEEELRRRSQSSEDPLLEEYLDFLRENRGRYIVLAVRVARPGLLNENRTREMEDKSLLRLGTKKFRVVGHFPPTQWDPYLRLVFPREIAVGDTTLRFELFLPGVPKPFRNLEFDIEALQYRDQPEM